MRRILLAACLLGWVGSAGAQEMKRPAITGIAFARFYTTDPAGAEKFYGQTLGYQKIKIGDETVYPVNSSQWIEVTDAAPPKPDSRLAAVAFTTRDAKGLEKYLEAKGYPAEMPLKAGEFGVRDPEGNLVIFVQAGSEKAVAKAPASPNATSHRIIHVGFLVRDAAKEDVFWKSALGFTPYWHGGKTETETDWVSQQVPEGTDWLEYMLNASPAPTLKQVGVLDHFSLGTTQMSNVVAQLAKNGCEGPNCAKTQIGRDGKTQLNLFDPDLTRVEFMEFKPVREACCSPLAGRVPGEVEDK